MTYFTEGSPLHQNMPSSITPSNVMPINNVGASKTVGEAIISSSGNKAKPSSTNPIRQTTPSSANKAKAPSTRVSQTTVNQKETKISKLSTYNQHCSKHNASAKKKASVKLPNINKVMSDHEKKSIELKF